MGGPIFDPALTLGDRRPFLAGEDALAWRVRTVLETRPGDVPWRPDFGCDLSSLVGQPATIQRVNEARWRVEEAIRRWIPEAGVVRCDVRVVVFDEGGRGRHPRTVPLAESALMSLGSQAALEVELDVETEAGPVSIEAVFEP
jgi:phage baseplate assembly protein W